MMMMMGEFAAFKNNTSLLLLLIATPFILLCLSSSAICDAATTQHWRSQHQLLLHHHNSNPTGGLTINVLDYGAKGDAKSDDTKAFQAAWADACKGKASTMIVPLGYKFLVGPTPFSGSNCHQNIVFQVDGTIVAPTNSEAWSGGEEQWLEFGDLVGFTLTGKGTLDGGGSVWWSQSVLDIKHISPKSDVSSSKNVKLQGTRPPAVVFFKCSDTTVTGITIQNSPQFHLTFDECDGVQVHDISISSPGDSPNTDGIYLKSTKNVIIHHTNLACGDDCISIQTGCTNVLVHDVNCGPGHGISIGSLGIDGITSCVSNITVRDIKLHDTMTGVRIKTWQGAKGLVRDVSFSNIEVSKVETPIMIDQYYCDHSICKNQTAAISIADIAFENIRGTYTVQPLHLSCSDSKPCMGLNLSDIELQPEPNGHQISGPFCWEAFGKLNAPVMPEVDCLQEGGPSNTFGPDDVECSV